MRLALGAFARADRLEIFDFIEKERPLAAVAVDERIEAATRLLLQFPEIGRTGRVVGTRELVVPSTPFVVVYAVQPEVVRILRVLHGARRWPPGAVVDQERET